MTTPAWRLKPLHAPSLAHLGEGVPVTDDPISLGRDNVNDVVIPAGEFTGVSAHHARAALENGVPVVEDLDSANGTFVNGKRIVRAELEVGDVVELGAGGPRFALTSQSDLSATVMGMTPPRTPVERPRRFGESTITNLRAIIGMASEKEVEEMVRRGTRRTRIVLGSVMVVVIAAAVYGYSVLTEREQESETRRQAENLALLARLEEAERDLATRNDAWRDQKAELETQRDELEARLESAVSTGSHATGALDELRAKLDVATSRLEMLDPVNIEEQRLRDVDRVRRAVVFLEVSVVYRNERENKLLYVDVDEAGRKEGNFSGRGDLFKRSSSGSGVVVTEEGWILTNAHVVRPPGSTERQHYRGDVYLEPEFRIDAIFSGESTRHEVEVVRVTPLEDDLALVRIEPFEGMASLPPPDLEARKPAPGSEVFLFGFPLGRTALQDGERVIASTFKGILSRDVGKLLQIDAGVHPGNSGGPVTDSSGALVGLVSQVQLAPDGARAATIGYVIPTAAISKVWPPGEAAATPK